MNARFPHPRHPIPPSLDGILDELDLKAMHAVEHKRSMEDILRAQSERPVLRPAPRKSDRFPSGRAA